MNVVIVWEQSIKIISCPNAALFLKVGKGCYNRVKSIYYIINIIIIKNYKGQNRSPESYTTSSRETKIALNATLTPNLYHQKSFQED